MTHEQSQSSRRVALRVSSWVAWALRPLSVRLMLALGFILCTVVPGGLWIRKGNSGLSMNLLSLYFADSGEQYNLDITVHGWPSAMSTWKYTVEVRAHRTWPPAPSAPAGSVKHEVVGYEEDTRRLFYIDAQTGVLSSVVGQWTTPLLSEQPRELLRWDSDGNGFTLIGSVIHSSLPEIRSDRQTFLWRPFMAWLGRRVWWGVLVFALLWWIHRCAQSALRTPNTMAR